MTAREVFYAVAALEARKSQESPPPQAEPKPAKKTPKHTPGQKTPPARQGGAGGSEPSYYTQAALVPLGIRYSLLHRSGDAWAEVDPETAFRAGDRIRLKVEVNDKGYLYIIHRGSSGIWKPLFPSPEIAGGDNRVERGRSYEIPAGYAFTFDEQPGVETLFLAVSRKPEADLESLIYSLGQGGKPPAAEEPASKKLLLAQNLGRIDDPLVGRLRDAYARDLIIEKVDESTPGPRREKAVYVANPSGSAESRVVADVHLTHK